MKFYHNNKRVRTWKMFKFNIKTKTQQIVYFLDRFIKDFGLGYAVMATVIIIFGVIGLIFNIEWVISVN